MYFQNYFTIRFIKLGASQAIYSVCVHVVSDIHIHMHIRYKTTAYVILVRAPRVILLNFSKGKSILLLNCPLDVQYNISEY